jgi:hypothetical protein
LEAAFENKEIIFFQTGGMVFALFLRDPLAADFLADPATFGRAAIAPGNQCSREAPGGSADAACLKYSKIQLPRRTGATTTRSRSGA